MNLSLFLILISASYVLNCINTDDYFLKTDIHPFLPACFIFLVSGLSGSTATAQSQVSVGIGLLAGSTVMLLTLIWGTCIVVGKCDIEDSIARDLKDTRGFSLTGMFLSS